MTAKHEKKIEKARAYSRNVIYLSQHLGGLGREFAGKYVALNDGIVVCCDKNFSRLMRRLKEKGIDDVAACDFKPELDNDFYCVQEPLADVVT